MKQNASPVAYNIYSKDCPARAFFDRLADHWTLLIIGLLKKEAFRFNQIKREVEGISQKVLSQKLKQLERDGLITRTAFPTVPVTVEYRLTDLGHSFMQTIEHLGCWAEQNIEQVKQAQKNYDSINA
ncbi:winged helix-turn-helix transcriptional regulator [Marinomonas spartinae]|uniref:winged helix-turn-helix transcriptional regulator n=1 Tax=Marinomonas spartinae TaxID=1792290 RepID=UPI0018F1CD03|nr:helix-turn-helix domain-containing protein [Marinomonas spartinae]MBJ7553802.1 helix-turn-helix transcriptional regulator [Marinomonas spartinae]